MLNKRPFGVALWAPLLIFTACSSLGKKSEHSSPLKLLIGDGSIRIEESFNHRDEQARATAAANFVPEVDKFNPRHVELAGKAWVAESSEYELRPKTKSKIECRIALKSKKVKRKVASAEPEFHFILDVAVSDGIKDGPFETLINGENEGKITFGEFPVNSWKSAENLVLNETVIASWFYEPDKKHYEIVKKMGENLFLKKTLRFDPYLRNISRVQYEILSGDLTQVDQQMNVLARLDCR